MINRFKYKIIDLFVKSSLQIRKAVTKPLQILNLKPNIQRDKKECFKDFKNKIRRRRENYEKFLKRKKGIKILEVIESYLHSLLSVGLILLLVTLVLFNIDTHQTSGLISKFHNVVLVVGGWGGGYFIYMDLKEAFLEYQIGYGDRMLKEYLSKHIINQKSKDNETKV